MPSTPHSDPRSDDRPSLYFEYARSAPALDELDVKAVHPDELLGRPAAFVVIGESHYVGLPSLRFHELCSCAPLSADPAGETPLSADVDRAFRFETDRLDATTTVRGRSLDAFPGPEVATVAHRFGPGAWTTLAVTDAGYETYHTYPEYGLALSTETRLTAPPAPDAGVASAAGDPAASETPTDHTP